MVNYDHALILNDYGDIKPQRFGVTTFTLGVT